ncbi:hypothetical protein [Streptomyces sp. NPDC059802]|uniref:hypothetical protein n=1 Tax=Streptomyces sp. NPDC059802 TaxID=3346952 RepID=UPI0036491590
MLIMLWPTHLVGRNVNLASTFGLKSKAQPNFSNRLSTPEKPQVRGVPVPGERPDKWHRSEQNVPQY